jgi:hypothetical protein
VLRTDDLGVLVDAIMMKSKDKDGNKIFKLDDKQVLLNKADPDVIARVATEMLNSIPIEEAEKK